MITKRNNNLHDNGKSEIISIKRVETIKITSTVQIQPIMGVTMNTIPLKEKGLL